MSLCTPATPTKAAAKHGPKGGDELNLLEAGRNEDGSGAGAVDFWERPQMPFHESHVDGNAFPATL